ncbi:unnamed protein product [Moneuplotes crassus]|uniref:Uncharacterized protein n=1 Tax=Euplotes crassus TaxID=5936 RepID=A0AAD1UCS0_EUPCR|nr:unnamed protein product [Moneuplotes crassus]
MEKFENPLAKKRIFDKSKKNIARIRETLLSLAKKEIDHFNSLSCKITIIQSQEECRKHLGLAIKNKFMVIGVSQGSTCVESSRSIGDSYDDEACSVSSDSDSNEVDLSNLIEEQVEIDIMDGKSGKVLTNSVN